MAPLFKVHQQREHETIVRMPLDHGADVNIHIGFDGSSLVAALASRPR